MKGFLVKTGEYDHAHTKYQHHMMMVNWLQASTEKVTRHL